MLILRKGNYTAMLVSTFTATRRTARAPGAIEATGTDRRVARLGTDRVDAGDGAQTPLEPKKAQTPLDPQKGRDARGRPDAAGREIRGPRRRTRVSSSTKSRWPARVEVSFPRRHSGQVLAGVKETATGHGEPIETCRVLGISHLPSTVGRRHGGKEEQGRANGNGSRGARAQRRRRHSAAITKRFAIELARRAASPTLTPSARERQALARPTRHELDRRLSPPPETKARDPSRSRRHLARSIWIHSRVLCDATGRKRLDVAPRQLQIARHRDRQAAGRRRRRWDCPSSEHPVRDEVGVDKPLNRPGAHIPGSFRSSASRLGFSPCVLGASVFTDSL
jgi:hypothetical protein